LLTQTEFNAVAPSATAPYTYAGLCTAITDWNTDNPSNQIFMGTTEMEQRHELAAFLGNTLHESGGFAAARECESDVRRQHRSIRCNVLQAAGYVAADKLFFGRGAIQLSWNYNYIDASLAITGDANTFCASPDLVATNESYAWGVGIWFWMSHLKDLNSVAKSSHDSILTDANFGGTVYNINGGL
ncbi:hypothetical protein THAPSDRAFT_264582, partial [Thalassiosira pseudonana CCMP1335]